jgi:hypothetical protein
MVCNFENIFSWQNWKKKCTLTLFYIEKYVYDLILQLITWCQKEAKICLWPHLCTVACWSGNSHSLFSTQFVLWGSYPQTSIMHPCETGFHRVGPLSMTWVTSLSELLYLTLNVGQKHKPLIRPLHDLFWDLKQITSLGVWYFYGWMYPTWFFISLLPSNIHHASLRDRLSSGRSVFHD